MKHYTVHSYTLAGDRITRFVQASTASAAKVQALIDMGFARFDIFHQSAERC